MLKPGMILCDRYEILDVVGAGGMSIVYKARCHRLNRNVAIKVLKPEFANDKNFVSKFRIEAQASAGLSHPNIVNVYDVYDDDGIYFIVMELVEGITLKEYIQQNGRLSMDKAIDFSIQIASGLEVAHENHIIHRDIKPQNIIVSRNGNVKVTDFGIAKAATSNTLTSGAMGSVHYISPEQARGGYSDERSDIYSLGITMYEMVTGRVPFEGDNNVSVALMHIQSDMIPPRQYYPDIYSSFEKVIMKATQKKPERRYLTASALIADLRRVQNNPNIDIVVAPTAITNSPTQEWTKEDVKAIRDGSANKDAYGNSQLNTFNNPPLTNDMGELRPIGGLSTIPVNQKINQLLDDEIWDDEEDEEPVAEPVRKGGIKKVADDDEDEDEDYNSDMDPNLKMAVTIAGIASAVIIAIVLIIVLGNVMGWFHGKKGNDEPSVSEMAEVAMISVVGDDVDIAKKKLEDIGIKNIKIETKESDTIDEGIVMDQNVKENVALNPEKDEVVLTVSAGAEPIDVPNVVGLEDAKAVTVLEEAGFVVRHAYEFSDEVEKDQVISTDPAAGQKLAKGETITVTVSNGKENTEVQVPNLNGLTEEAAKAMLESFKLKLGEVKKENSEDVKEGLVISSDPAMNTTVKEGDTVNITVSKGPVEKVVTYTANVTANIQSDGTYDGRRVKVQIIFNGEPISEQTTTASAGFTITGSKVGLETESGSATIAVILDEDIPDVASKGTNITNNFNASTSITYVKVETTPEE